MNDIDADALLAVNGMHDLFQDAFWWMLTAKWSSLLLVLALAWVLMYQNRRHALLMLVMLALTVLVGILKILKLKPYLFQEILLRDHGACGKKKKRQM